AKVPTLSSKNTKKSVKDVRKKRGSRPLNKTAQHNGHGLAPSTTLSHCPTSESVPDSRSQSFSNLDQQVNAEQKAGVASAEVPASSDTNKSHGERTSTSSNIENGVESVSVAETTATVATLIEETPAVDKKAARKATKKANKERNRANRAGATVVAEGMSVAEKVSSSKKDVTGIPAVDNISSSKEEEPEGLVNVDPTVNFVKNDAGEAKPSVLENQQQRAARNAETVFIKSPLSNQVLDLNGETSSTKNQVEKSAKFADGNTAKLTTMTTTESSFVDKKTARKATQKTNKERNRASRAGTIIAEAVIAAEKVSSSSEVSNDLVTLNDTVEAPQILHDEACNKTPNNDIPGLNEPVPEITGERETNAGEIPASKIHDVVPDSAANDIIAVNDNHNDILGVKSTVTSVVDVTAFPQPMASSDDNRVDHDSQEERLDAAAHNPQRDTDEPKTVDHGNGGIETVYNPEQVESQVDNQVSVSFCKSEMPDIPEYDGNIITSVGHIEIPRKLIATEPSVAAPNTFLSPSVTPKSVIFVAKAPKKATKKAEKQAKKELKRAQQKISIIASSRDSDVVLREVRQPNDKAIDEEKDQKSHTEKIGVAEKLEPVNIEGHEVQDVDTTLGSNHVDEASTENLNDPVEGSEPSDQHAVHAPIVHLAVDDAP
ncbi:hypothetical protein HDU76_006224, partial [Blyttiomyces sp. JEL0837]